MLQSIAGTVNLPEYFFIRSERQYPRGTVFYRSMSSATKSARARAERRFAWLRDVVRYLSDHVAWPIANFPALDLPSDPLLLSDQEIENAADEVRTYWGLQQGPVANVVRLLENQGAIVARDRLGAETLDGLSEFVLEEHRPYVIVGTDKGTPARWRFDAAHELGHVVLHAGVSAELLSRPEHFKRIEHQAHRFAAAFLLPLAPFGDDLFAANLDALQAIKPKWKVSISMMIKRAQDGDLISEDTARKLWINASRRGWRRMEPYDNTMEIEEPLLLKQAFELVLGEGGQTSDDVLASLALPASDIESLCGLPSGYLSGPSLVSLRTRQVPVGPSSTATPGEIVRLPLRPRV